MYKHAIIIGGSIAGLVTARVLLNHFERVTLIERDSYPQEPVARPGIPQGRQVHTTLLRGQRALEQLFPGLATNLLGSGAVERDYGAESLYYYGGGRCPRIPPVLHGWNCSRLLLEWQLRQELSEYSQLAVTERHEVSHLLFEENAVIGVQMLHREDSSVQELRADLVVDASGSTSHALQWLQELGYDAPPRKTVTANLGYATRFYSRVNSPWKGIAIQATSHPPRGGVLMEIEHGNWMVVLSGANGDYPPTEEQAFLEFARGLPDAALYEAMQNAIPSSKIYGYRYAENRWIRFEQLRRWPEGFIVVGDAVCHFNPLYGQGITVATLEALHLDAYLTRGMRKGFARVFQKKVSRIVFMPWMLATSADRRNQTRTRGLKYTDHLLATLPRDPTVMLTFLEVVHMLKHPVVLFSPPVLMKVLKKR